MSALKILVSGCMLLLHLSSFAQCYFFNLYRHLQGNDFDAGTSIIALSDGGFISTSDSDYSPGNAAILTVRVNECGDTIWQKVYDYSPSGGERSNSILKWDDNKFYLMGRRFNPTEGARDGFLIVTDSNGIALYETGINLGFNDLHNLAILDDGYILTAGHYNNSRPNAGAFLAKIDSAGNVLWHQVYDTLTNYISPVVNKTFDGGYMLTGRISAPPNNFWFMIKTDSLGNKQWEKILNDPSWGWGGYSIVTGDSGYTIVGHTRINASEFYAYIVRTDISGNKIWSQMYGDTMSNLTTFRNIKQLNDGNYIAVGEIRNTSGGINLWIVKLDYLGNILWIRQHSYYGGQTSNYVEDMTITPEGDIALTGYITAVPPSHTTGNDMFILKVDSCGYLESDSIEAAFSYNIDTLTNVVSFTNQSTEYCTSYWYFGDEDSSTIKNPTHTYADTGTYTVTLITRAGNSLDTLIQKITIQNLGVGIEQPSTDNQQLFKLYPNPTSGEFQVQRLKFKVDETYELRLYDVLGRNVLIEQLEDSQIKVDVSELETGVYFYSIQSNQVPVKHGKIVIN